MPDPSVEWTAASIESLLGNTPVVRNFKATFDVEVQPSGPLISFEVTMPDGAMRLETGREVPEQFVPRGALWGDLGRYVIHLLLYPKLGLERGRGAVIRVVR